MKLYQDPISTTSRPVLLFLAEHELPVELVHVDLMSDGQHDPAFTALNPNAAVPVLVDGDLVLPESSAILKYLSDVAMSPAYPVDLKQRARINAMMDWFHTGVSREFGYHYVYPSVFPMHRFASPAAQAEIQKRGRDGFERMFAVLDSRLADHAFVCGDQLTIADYLGVVHLGMGELIDFDFAPWPNLAAWLGRMKARPSWGEVHAAFYGLAAMLRDRQRQAS